MGSLGLVKENHSWTVSIFLAPRRVLIKVSVASLFRALLSCPGEGTARCHHFIDVVFEAMEAGWHLKMVLWTLVGTAAGMTLDNNMRGLCFLRSLGGFWWVLQMLTHCSLEQNFLSQPQWATLRLRYREESRAEGTDFSCQWAWNWDNSWLEPPCPAL